MSTRTQSPWILVTAREVMVKLTDRNFLIGTLVTLLMVIIAMALPLLMNRGDVTYEIGLIEQESSSAAPVIERVEAAVTDDETHLEVIEQADREAAEQAVRDGDVDLALVGSPGQWSLLTDADPSMTLSAAVEEAVRQQVLTDNATAAGTDLAQLTAGTQVTRVDVSENTSGLPPGTAFLAPLIFGALFYLAAIVFGMQISSSVVEEKQSRIVEILAAKMPTRQLLVGKVVGNTLLAFGQMALLVAAALIGLPFTGFDVALPGLAEALGWYLPFFVLGFGALACIWAAAGALASRFEDLQSTTMPLQVALVAVFIGGINLTGTAREVGSFVPVLSTILMPARLLEGSADWWEPVFALVLVLAFCGLTIAIGAKLYDRALLHTSGTLSWRRALALKGD